MTYFKKIENNKEFILVKSAYLSEAGLEKLKNGVFEYAKNPEKWDLNATAINATASICAAGTASYEFRAHECEDGAPHVIDFEDDDFAWTKEKVEDYFDSTEEFEDFYNEQ
jgi:hypothetical protein